MILLPKELPELRDYLADYAESRAGVRMWLHNSTANDADMETPAAKARAEELARGVATSMREAELLLHVNPSMVDLLMQARHGVGSAGFMGYDLPAETGVAYFARQVGTDPQIGAVPLDWESVNAELAEMGVDPVEFREQHEALGALSYPEHLLCTWEVLPPGSTEFPGGCVRLAWWYERESFFEAWRQISAAVDQPDPTLEWRDESLPRFIPDGWQHIGFHPDSASVQVDPGFAGDKQAKSRRPDMFRALCYLLRQRVAEESTVMPDRAARRRMARQGREPQPVRVISIRGGSAHGGGDGSREYVHRWVVRGHWRRQWYRSIQAHRPVWITPYVKGPEDAPLLGGEKVYSVAP